MMIADDENTSHELTNKLEIKDRYAQVGTFNLFKSVTLNLKGGLSVENGGLLLQNSFSGSVTSAQNQKIVVQLGESAEVKEKGRLILDGTDNVASDIVGSRPSELIAPDGKNAIIVKNGGQVEIANFDVKRSVNESSDASLIDVQDGGELRFFASGLMDFDEQTGMPVYVEGYENPNVKVDLDNGASNSPAVSVANGANVTVEAGDFTAEGTGTIFDLAEGATLNLEGGTIKNTTNAPAINANSGATVVIPKNSEAEVKSDKGEAAIDLAKGSKVEIAGTKVTVGTDGENYVGNNGITFLDVGATNNKNESLNHAVLLPNGTIVQGTADNKPTVEKDDKGEIQVTVPDGGSVMEPNGTTTNMPNGGNVSTDGNDTTVKPEPVPSGGGGGGSTQKLNKVYRAYNPNNGEHLHTLDEKEFKHVTSLGWHDEGVAFMAETEKSGQALYRVYNPNSGLHHYTTDENEKNTLVSLGWNEEGIAWYASKKPQSAPVYRVYNPNDGQHHYTVDEHEKDVLVSLGWTYEGIAFKTAPIEK